MGRVGAMDPQPVDQTESSVNVGKVTKRLYNLAEAAIYLGRSTWSVRRLIWVGELPQVRAGGRVHVDLRDMDAFIERNKVREEGVSTTEKTA